LPLVAAAEARRQGRRVVAVGLYEETDPRLADEADVIHWVRLGQLGAIVRALRQERVTDVVLLGKVAITHLFARIRPDLLAAKALLAARDRRGDSLLEAIVRALEAEGFLVLPTPAFLTPLVVQPGQLTRRGPSRAEASDIRLGREVARQIAALRVGQTVVVKHGTVLAVESKVSRPGQDLRYDLPTIGAETLKALQEAEATALALDAGTSLLLERDRFVAGADAMKLAVVAD